MARVVGGRVRAARRLKWLVQRISQVFVVFLWTNQLETICQIEDGGTASFILLQQGFEFLFKLFFFWLVLGPAVIDEGFVDFRLELAISLRAFALLSI